MRKFILLIACILLCCLSLTAFAAAKSRVDVTDDELKAKETITVNEMNERLQAASDEDLLYVKIKS